jgi:methyl-galactoside transport system permease protein
MSFVRDNWNKMINRFRENIKSIREMNKQDWAQFFINNAILFIILAMIVVVIVLEPSFLSVRVFTNILRQSSVRLIIAFGVAGIINLQGTDLSFGRQVGFAAVITGSLLQAPDYLNRFYPDLWLTSSPIFVRLIFPLLVSMLVLGVISVINGLVAAVFKVHPFIVTLGTSVTVYGILSLYFGAGAPGPQPIGGFDTDYSAFVNGYMFDFGNWTGIPNLIVYAIIVSILMWVLWNKTKFGKDMYAVGGNPEAAKVSGVNVVKTFVLVYLLAGVLYALGGFLEAARIGSANNSTGFGYELDAIAACVVGGISFSGGVGRVSGAIAGVLMFTIIAYGMNFLGLDVFYQYIIKGIIIVTAVALDTRKYLKKS